MEFIDKLSRNTPPTIHWDGEQTRDFIYVGDIVEALVKSMNIKKALGETMILGSGVETTINQLYKSVCDQLGVNITPKHGPKALGDIHRMCYNCIKAKKILGWEPHTTLNEGIENIVKEMKLQ